MGRSGARAVMTSLTARIARGERGQCLRVPGASLGSGVGPRAPYIACLTHLVGTLAAGVSAAGLWEILRSRKKISHFGLTSGATRLLVQQPYATLRAGIWAVPARNEISQHT